MKHPDWARGLASSYIRGSFEPGDHLAVVILNKCTSSVIQRISTSEKIAADDFQAWLREQNAQKCEIYISMNALQPGTRGRTKADVAAIRHIYLDFDENGTAAVQHLFRRQDLPSPSYLLNTSPDKWQVTWRVEGFTKDESEHLQKALALQTGADTAATDCTRVLRLPGFFNHKYARPYIIRVEPHAAIAGAIYRPEHFPRISFEERAASDRTARQGIPSGRQRTPGTLSQSERDWAYAKRALARGESPVLVASAIASHRRYDKHNPQYYAEITVKKAAEALKAEEAWVRAEEPERT